MKRHQNVTLCEQVFGECNVAAQNVANDIFEGTIKLKIKPVFLKKPVDMSFLCTLMTKLKYQ